ncbi:MAG: class I SAM-dependent methyltransferase [Luteolibacter sp.]
MTQFDYSIYYSRFHDDSEEYAESMAKSMEMSLRKCLPDDTKARILDIGCGYGFALRALRNLGYQNIEGLEISSAQADRATRAGFLVGLTEDTIRWLNAHSNEFDHVILFDVLEHVPVGSQIDLIAAIHTSLRRGGAVQLTVPNANAILAARWLHNDYTHHSSFTEHSLYFVLKNGGFDRIEIDAEKGLGRFPRRLWRRSAWPAVRKWLVRWCWLQVHKAEIPWEKLDEISFELNHKAVATK